MTSYDHNKTCDLALLKSLIFDHFSHSSLDDSKNPW